MTENPLAGRASDLPAFVDPTADALVGALAAATGDKLQAVLLFGSRLALTEPSPFSAYDLVAVVEDYLGFYRRLHESGSHGRNPRVLTALANVLPPNVISFDPHLPGGQIAKVMVFTFPDLSRALSNRARDHFLRGRMAQRTAILMTRDPALHRDLETHLAGTRRDVLRWAGPWLPDRFTALDLARGMLEVSYAAEVRPETGGRVAAVFEAQKAFLENVYTLVLEEAARDGDVMVADRADAVVRWRLTTPPGRWDALRLRSYFAFSKARATARWLKHVVTFDDWLTYLQQKVERRTGMRVELTDWERRLPLLLLWPKVFRVLGELRASRSRP